MTVSIVICTRNRASSLRPTLESIGRARVPIGWSVELLVVDNGSTDHTAETVRMARVPNLNLRYTIEARPGQCHARNRGLAETAGQIILFTDDDVRVPGEWIESMCAPIIDTSADAVAGGVHFPPELGRALSRSPLMTRRGWFACTSELHPVSPTRMVGANMAFGRHVLRSVPSFDPELGPGALGFADDTLFSQRLLHAGFRITGRLNVRVDHHFDVSRIEYSSLLSLAERMGRSQGYLAYHWNHERVRFPRIKQARHLAALWLNRVRNLPAWLYADIPTESELCDYWHYGYHEQYARERRRASKYGLSPSRTV